MINLRVLFLLLIFNQWFTAVDAEVVEAKQSTLVGERIVEFIPNGFDQTKTPSLILKEEPISIGEVPADWDLFPEFSLINDKASASLELSAEISLYGGGEVTGYLLSAGTERDINVQNWALEHSTDGHTYFPVTPSAYKDLSSAILYFIERSPNVSQNQASRYYRLTAQGGAVGEVQLFGVPYLLNNDGKSFPEDITEGISLISKVFGQPLGAYSGIADERYFNLFDRNMTTKYYWGNGPVFDVEIELDDYYNLSYYTLTSCQDFPRKGSQNLGG